ncbi:MAG TPA: preprotein translocase subunit SecE [Jatrophihabitantaceae bacterium]|nr:preprotein translocase subunit SecE [Jatrophihabitantaceae bacterium]
MTATRTETASPRPAGGGRGGRVGRFSREVISEMRKVLWPSRHELLTYTAVVIVFVVVMVSIVAGLDIGFAKLVLWLFG